MQQEEDDEASATDLHGGEKQSQRDRGTDPESVEDVEETQEVEKTLDRSRVKVSEVPAQPEPGAEDDEGHPEEKNRLETTANGGGGTDGNTVMNSHSSSRVREERGRREESGDRVR